MTAIPGMNPFTTIRGGVPDPYQGAVEDVYRDDPALWKSVIGESLWFQFGVYDEPSCGSPEEAGRRYFDLQLEVAGMGCESRVGRVLDVGSGWGAVLDYLPRVLPACPRFDAVNVSARQLEYTARRLSAHDLAHRVRLYQCNARDIALLPDPDQPYDLVVTRGSITHFTNEVLHAAIGGLAACMRAGGTLIISENLYNIDPAEYHSAIADITDRLACGNRKTLRQLTEVLVTHGFTIQDVRKLPTNDDAIRWLRQVRDNIETHVPADGMPRALADLREHAVNWSAALRSDAVSVYSVIATLGALDG